MLHVLPRAGLFCFVVLAVVAWMRIPFHVSVAPRDASAAQVALLATPPADPHDVRIIQSPVLFSLPSAAGFSHPLRGTAMDVSVPPDPPPARLYLTPTPEFPRGLFGLTGKTLGEMIEAPIASAPVLMTAGPVVLNDPGDEVSGYRVSWQDNPSEDVHGLEIPDLPAGAPVAPWQAIYYVCFNASGFPEQVLVEEPPPSIELNEEWVRIVRGWRPLDRDVPFCRRLVVSYRPDSGRGP